MLQSNARKLRISVTRDTRNRATFPSTLVPLAANHIMYGTPNKPLPASIIDRHVMSTVFSALSNYPQYNRSGRKPPTPVLKSGATMQVALKAQANQQLILTLRQELP